MKTIAYIIVILFLFPFKGQCQSSSLQPDSISALFQLFLNDFTVNDRKEIDILTFGGDVFQQMIDTDRYGMFLPEPNDCDCSLINWQQGSFLQKGDVVVVFMERFCQDDEFYDYCDYMVLHIQRTGIL
ncbi:MAG: hypothetical protein LUD00_05125 [Prevotellaceae bacterium]|nr:hypothetical protein [Prevotellaceae bacterium]